MKQWVILFFFFLLSFNISNVSAFEIKKPTQKLFSLSKDLFEKYEQGTLQFLSNGDFWISCTKTGCSTVTSSYGSFSWELVIQYNNFSRQIPLSFSIAYPKYFSLSHKIDKTYQERALSCEMSAAQDVMNYLGNTNITEIELIEKIPKSFFNQLPYEENGRRFWWNPEWGFVWYIHQMPNKNYGAQYNYTWYGVLDQPIEKLYNMYWYETLRINSKDYKRGFFQKEHLTLLLQELVEWNMVQLWWDYFCDFNITNATNTKTCTQSRSKNRVLEWYYKDENGNIFKHEWLSWEHAFYLLWYRWDISHPRSVIVWDTTFWELEIPISEWYRKWNLLQNRSIIIYKK